MKLTVLVVTFLMISWLAAYAGESQKAAGRTISYRTAVEVLERDTEDNPVKGTAERIGVTLHELGPAAGGYSQVRILSTWERTDQGGIYSGTLHRTYADDEEQDLAIEGRFGKGRSEGTYECTGGTGKYATATCNGTYESESFPNGMAANRWSGTITFAD
jgi:hypothetical protein